MLATHEQTVNVFFSLLDIAKIILIFFRYKRGLIVSRREKQSLLTKVGLLNWLGNIIIFAICVYLYA